jgi:hypothetical protein
MKFTKRVKLVYQNFGSISHAFLLWIKDGISKLTGKESESQKLYRQRIKICRVCKFKRYNDTEMCVIPFSECCGLCGCTLRLKLRLKEEKCPIGEW